MKTIKSTSGFALLNALLGITLLTGIIFLIMHAMTNYHSEEKARELGEELAAVVNALLLVDDLAEKSSGYLLSNASLSECSPTGALLVNIISKGTIQSLQTTGFNLCAAPVDICDTVDASKGEC
ncbi:MAG: hypothetical protein V4496_04405 [Pseudomonadota bacterium]